MSFGPIRVTRVPAWACTALARALALAASMSCSRISLAPSRPMQRRWRGLRRLHPASPRGPVRRHPIWLESGDKAGMVGVPGGGAAL